MKRLEISSSQNMLPTYVYNVLTARTIDRKDCPSAVLLSGEIIRDVLHDRGTEAPDPR